MQHGAVMGGDRMLSPEEVRRMDALVAELAGALVRIAERMDAAELDLGVEQMVPGDVARGTVLTVRGIARAALAKVEE